MLVQGVDCVEHIVVDGGSRDETVAIVQSSPGTRLLERHGANQSRAINEGFRAARGQVLAWLNADDEYAPGALRCVTEQFMTRPDLDVLIGDCEVIGSDGKLRWTIRPGRFDMHRLLTRGNYLGQPAVFLHRRAIDRVGYLDEAFEYAMDFEFWLRLGACRVDYTPRVLARYRWHPSSKTARNQLQNWRELLRAIRRHGGGWTVPLVWSFLRMLVTLSRQRVAHIVSARFG